MSSKRLLTGFPQKLWPSRSPPEAHVWTYSCCWALEMKHIWAEETKVLGLRQETGIFRIGLGLILGYCVMMMMLRDLFLCSRWACLRADCFRPCRWGCWGTRVRQSQPGCCCCYGYCRGRRWRASVCQYCVCCCCAGGGAGARGAHQERPVAKTHTHICLIRTRRTKAILVNWIPPNITLVLIVHR